MRYGRSVTLFPMTQRLPYLCSICCLLMLSGCASTSQGRRNVVSRERELSDLKSEMVTLKATVEDLTIAQERICSDMETLRSSSDALVKDVQTALRQLRESARKSEPARALLKSDLVRDLS